MADPINNPLTMPHNESYVIQNMHPTGFTFSLPNNKGTLTIRTAEQGFDIEIPAGTPMTDAFKAFVDGLRPYLKNLKL